MEATTCCHPPEVGRTEVEQVLEFELRPAASHQAAADAGGVGRHDHRDTARLQEFMNSSQDGGGVANVLDQIAHGNSAEKARREWRGFDGADMYPLRSELVSRNASRVLGKLDTIWHEAPLGNDFIEEKTRRRSDIQNRPGTDKPPQFAEAPRKGRPLHPGGDLVLTPLHVPRCVIVRGIDLRDLFPVRLRCEKLQAAFRAPGDAEPGPPKVPEQRSTSRVSAHNTNKGVFHYSPPPNHGRFCRHQSLFRPLGQTLAGALLRASSI